MRFVVSLKRWKCNSLSWLLRRYKTCRFSKPLKIRPSKSEMLFESTESVSRLSSPQNMSYGSACNRFRKSLSTFKSCSQRNNWFGRYFKSVYLIFKSVSVLVSRKVFTCNEISLFSPSLRMFRLVSPENSPSGISVNLFLSRYNLKRLCKPLNMSLCKTLSLFSRNKSCVRFVMLWKIPTGKDFILLPHKDKMFNLVKPWNTSEPKWDSWLYSRYSRCKCLKLEKELSCISIIFCLLRFKVMVLMGYDEYFVGQVYITIMTMKLNILPTKSSITVRFEFERTAIIRRERTRNHVIVCYSLAILCLI